MSKLLFFLLIISNLTLNTFSKSNIRTSDCIDEESNWSINEKNEYESCCKQAVDENNPNTTFVYELRFDITDISQNYACKCFQFKETDTMINYMETHYCQSRKSFSKINAWPGLVITLWTPVLVYFFFLLASTADQFLVPSLQKLSSIFKLSPSLAGAV